MFAGGTGTGVFRSNDGGESWAPVTEDYADADVTGIAISPNYRRDRIVFAATNIGLLRTTDGGNEWTELDRGIDTDEIRAVGVSSTYARDRTVFAGGPQGFGYKSTDNGNSWNRIDYEFDGETIASIATGPDFANDQTVFVGTLGERMAAVHLSTDGGATFERFVEHDSASPWIALGIPPAYTPEDRWWMFATAGQVFKPAERFSDTWNGTYPASRLSAVLAIVPAPVAGDERVFAATSAGVYRSVTGAASWQPINEGLSNLAVLTVVASPDFAEDQSVYAMALGGEIWRWIDDPPEAEEEEAAEEAGEESDEE